jgi:phage tail sheath protein FI
MGNHFPKQLRIILKKAISTVENCVLIEPNDEFTRSQFRNLVNPFLNSLVGQRAITDFKVVCDETNNTAQVIDSNQFVADIFVKRAEATDYICLKLTVFGTGITFTEII